MSESIDLEILDVLYAATEDGLMTWEGSGDDGFFARFGEDDFEIVLISLQRAGESTREQVFARIQNRNMYETYPIGSDGYERLMTILRLNVHGWSEGFAGRERKLNALLQRLRAERAEQDSDGKPDIVAS